MATVNDQTRHTCVNDTMRAQLAAMPKRKRWVVEYIPKPKRVRRTIQFSSMQELFDSLPNK